MRVFGVLEAIVIGLGSLVGGVIGVLLPRIANGIAVGFLIALLVEAATFGDEGPASSFVSSIVFISAIAASIFGAQKYEEECSLLRSSLATGLLFALSVDFLLQSGLMNLVSRILRMKPFDNSLCYKDCHIPQLLSAWFFIALVSFLVQSRIKGLWMAISPF